ncbi:CHRNB3 [Branchiostoma lanceolatum]|uniref:CHRNB3 protein n=1 Tax=Branchiostoma lanceolatum TaxID=7740 RepID=A0A8K0AAM1_BRALA|nr:CHRNB3 [Branchiostoma lanceolatum]
MDWQRMDALFVVLLVSVTFVCGQQGATSPPRPEGTTTPIVFRAERGSFEAFESPGYPDEYPNSMNITWRIEARNDDDVVHLAFDHFDLERPDVNEDCSWDFVAVYDGINDLKGKFCGNVLPPEIKSSSNVLSVVFTSDFSAARAGFRARYWATSNAEENSGPEAAPSEFNEHCKHLGFDSVTFPNFYGNGSVEETLASRQWQEMVSVNSSCHPQIQLFLCSLLMPRFTESRKQLPCQSWCHEVRTSCGPSIDIDCQRLPFNATECVNLDPPEDCYYGNGANYRGKGTLPENRCLNWTSPEVFGPMVIPLWAQWADIRENYCRNYLPERGCGPPPWVSRGSTHPVKNFYRIGEHVSISCDVGYIMEEEDMWMTCTGEDTWSKEQPNCAVDHRLRLTNTLLDSKRYNPQLAPSRHMVNVTFEAAVVDIIDADEKNEDLFSSIAFKLQWKDNRLSWTHDQNGDVRELSLSRNLVWIPKVFLHRNGDARFRDFSDGTVTVTSAGIVEWDVIDVLTTTCDLDSTLFPFDSMECPVCLGIDTRVVRFDCQKSTNITRSQSVIKRFMTCGEEDAMEADEWLAGWKIDVNEGLACIKMKFDRIPTAHFCTTLSPVIILSVLMCITFVLPTDKGDRLSFGMTILLSMVVSLVFISDVLPTKGSMPVVAVLVIVYMCMMGFFVLVSVMIIRISSREKDLPPVVKKVFLRYLARLVFLGDLTKAQYGRTVLTVNEDDFEMVEGLTGKDSKPSKASEAEQGHLEVLLSLKESINDLSKAVESFGTSGQPKTTEASKDETVKTDYHQLVKVLDRLCLILYVFGWIIAIPIVRFSKA